MNMKHSGRYVAYYRVSTAQQGRSGLGLEAQRLAVGEPKTRLAKDNIKAAPCDSCP